MATAALYDITQLEIDETDVLEQAQGKHNWQALSSALHQNVSYEFVTDQPFEYMDFRQRYLVTKVDRSQAAENTNSNKANLNKDKKDSKNSSNKYLLAYLLNITVSESDFGETQAQIPSAIIEDIIADVELMKGQSQAFGNKFQVFHDVCINYGGMAMSTGRTFDIGDSSARDPSNARNNVQVTLI